MKHIKTFISLTEAISLAAARKATKIFIDSGGKQRYNEIFNGKDRLYYDLEDSFKPSYIYNPLENQVKIALENFGYSIVDYNSGIASKKDDDKNVFKIQKILNKIGELDLKNKMDADSLRFSSTKKNKMIVISRHGVDIAGQSTGRDWTSCKSIITGVRQKYVWSEIKQGSLVAYLITPEDVNLKKPIARILIGVYISEKDPKDFILYPDSSVYGNYGMSDFMDFVKKWCTDVNRKLSPKNEGTYTISNKCHVDIVRKVNIYDSIFDDIKGYLGSVDSDVNISKQELKDADIKNIFKSIEDQESGLEKKDVFNLFKKIKIDIEPIGYAGFINENSYNEIKKYLDKYPDFFVNYITELNYNLILDKNKENQIRKAIQSYLLELEGPDYIQGFKAILDTKSDVFPLNFIRWILL